LAQGIGASNIIDTERQTTRFDKKLFTRTNWISINSFRGDFRTPTPFNRLINANDNRGTTRHKDPHQQM
jgi:hypothetical protein